MNVRPIAAPVKLAPRPRVKFLLTVWGEWYIETLARLSLPSFLAPGNLPALAEGADLEVLIMTAAADVPMFRRHAAFHRLEALCPVRFIAIDDLIFQDLHGVTLSLAFARGVMDSGARQTDTYFIFMNADFVLADGSLRSIANRIGRGDRCIVAPSLRAAAEPVEPILLEAVDRQRHELIMSSRALVGLAIDNMHPTTIGKTVTQNLVHCTSVNQLYWRVDHRTLLGRYHLMFMLCIRPEQPLGPINSFCDYGFVPEMTPSGEFTVLQESDEFFMLELQRTEQEKESMGLGPISRAAAARSLVEWTTPEQRRYAQFDLVFNAADPPDDLDRFKSEAAAYVRDVHARMPDALASHAYHPYWVGTLRFRVINQGQRRLADLPREINLNAALYPLTRRTAARGAGDGDPNTSRQIPSPWRHDWLDHRLLREWLAETDTGPSGSSIIIHPTTPHAGSCQAIVETFEAVELEALIRPSPESKVDPRQYERALFCIEHSNLRCVADIVEALTPRLVSGGEIGIFVPGLQSETSRRNSRDELMEQLWVDLPVFLREFDVEIRYVGGSRKRKLRRTQLRLESLTRSKGLKRIGLLPFGMLGRAVVTTLIGLNNRLNDGPTTSVPRDCSSALLRLRRRSRQAAYTAPMPDAVAPQQTAVAD
jgi:hypothetical protein